MRQKPCPYNTGTAHFHHAFKHLWRLRQQLPSFSVQEHAIIRDKSPEVPARSCRLENCVTQRRLAAPGLATDQKSLGSDNKAVCVNVVGCHFLRPTGKMIVNRAPAIRSFPSLPASIRLVAEIDPPCASMICLEIERPRPELFPKPSPSGLSV